MNWDLLNGIFGIFFGDGLDLTLAHSWAGNSTTLHGMGWVSEGGAVLINTISSIRRRKSLGLIDRQERVPKER